MIQIISGTDRPRSRTRVISQIVSQLYQDLKAPCEILDLAELNPEDLLGGHYNEGPRGSVKEAVEKVTKAEGIVLVIPEYNGSYPGILKLFVDYWKYPQSFEARPFCFIGLGTRWGGLRPVEHLQQAFGYRNGYCFPNRVFIQNIYTTLTKEGVLTEPLIRDLLKTQATDFIRFIQALKSQGLDANSRLLTAGS